MSTSTYSYVKINRPIDLPMMQETLRAVRGAALKLVQDYRESKAPTFVPIPHAIVGGFDAGLNDDLTYFRFNFRLGEEECRDLSIHFGCHHDSDYLFEGENIILSLNVWGSSDLIMRSFSEALIKLDFVDGVWYVPTDTDEDTFIKYEKSEQ